MMIRSSTVADPTDGGATATIEAQAH